MKRNVLFGSILAAAMSVGVAAQAGTTPQTGSSSPRRHRAGSRSSQTVTSHRLSAVVVSAVSDRHVGRATAAGASSADNFILANANAAAGSRAPGASSSTPRVPRLPRLRVRQRARAAERCSASASQYKLVGGNKDDLRRYVNSQVEITGKIDSSASSSGAAMGGTATGAGSTATGSASTGSTATAQRDRQQRVTRERRRCRR